MKAVDKDTAEIIASFVSEGYERLDDAEKELEKISGACSEECVGTVFRLFHSVKGTAGYLGFEGIKVLTHEAETLLDVFKKGKAHPEPEEIEVVYQTIDLLRKMVQTVEKENTD
jgi:two-component system, chemotaxis family, sensor kinase CheA